MKTKPHISLLAKWLKSENTSSAESRRTAAKIRNHLGWSSKQYRVTLSTLRAYLNVVEQKMSAQKWSDIKYDTVPSKANLNYKKAFSRHDAARYTKFIEDVKAGKTKINAGTLFPYEIVGKALNGDKSDSLDVLWNNLPNYLEGNDRNILCLVDSSGSMNGLPLNIAVSLGIYTSERNKGPFSGYFLTFSSRPQLQKVIGNNIFEKAQNLSRAGWEMNTNVQAAFSLILNEAVKNKVKQKDMPVQVVIISDMQMDSGTAGNTSLDDIKLKYKKAGYETPQLVWWQVNARQDNVPAKFDSNGNVLVSGASPSVFKSLLSGKEVTPQQQMLETLNDKQYDRVVI